MVQNLLESGDTGARKRRPVKAGFQLDRRSVGEAASLPGSGSLGLKRFQAEQGEPVRMGSAGHQLARALALAPGMAAQEAAMVQKEAQQLEVGTAEVPAQGEVAAQPRIQVLHERAAARGVRHGPADGGEQGVELAAQLRA